jgi:hypothetical protein
LALELLGAAEGPASRTFHRRKQASEGVSDPAAQRAKPSRTWLEQLERSDGALLRGC